MHVETNWLFDEGEGRQKEIREEQQREQEYRVLFP